MTEAPRFITVAEAAKLLGVTPRVVRWHLGKGLTRYERMGKVLLSEQEVREFGAIRPVTPPTSSVSRDDMEDGE